VEIFVDFRFTVAALADRPETMELVHQAIHVRQTFAGKPWGTLQTIEAGEFAAPHLSIEGLALREVDGMTHLWNVFAAVPMVLLWPPLPRSEKPGRAHRRARALRDRSGGLAKQQEQPDPEQQRAPRRGPLSLRCRATHVEAAYK